MQDEVGGQGFFICWAASRVSSTRGVHPYTHCIRGAFVLCSNNLPTWFGSQQSHLESQSGWQMLGKARNARNARRSSHLTAVSWLSPQSSVVG
jgi:hypothetical protein